MQQSEELPSNAAVYTMDKQQLLKQLDNRWAFIKESYAGLPEAQLMEAGVTGNWSVRDILAHVTTWEEEALKYLPLILQGGKPPRYSTKYGGIDAFNAQVTEQKRGLSLPDVLRQLDETHRRLIAYVEGAPEEQSCGRRASGTACGRIHTAITRSMPPRYLNGERGKNVYEPNTTKSSSL